MKLRKVSSVSGLVPVPVPGELREEILVCQFTDMVNSGGYAWYGGDPFSYTLPTFMFQISIFVLLSRFVFLAVEPLKQSMLTAQIIAGILLGKSFLGRFGTFTEAFFPPGGRTTLDTAAELGLIFHLFILGIHVDPTMITKTRKDAIVIGVSGFVFPLVLGSLAAIGLSHVTEMDGGMQQAILRVATLNALSSFPVITSLLADLKLLNSDLGRIATLACSVIECFNYLVYFSINLIGTVVKHRNGYIVAYYFAYGLGLVTLYMYISRPCLRRLARNAPEGRPLKELQFLTILTSALMCGFLTELMGMPAGIGAFVFGVAVPDGPPIGSYLIHKLDGFCTGLLLPAKFVAPSMAIDIFSVATTPSGMVIELVIIVGYVGKFTGVFLSALYFRTHIMDAVCLGLIISCKGIMEVVAYIMLREGKLLDDESFALLLLNTILFAGLARPLVAYIYDPARRFRSGYSKSILLADPDEDLRIMMCVHNQENVPAMLSLLEASYASPSLPISVSVLNLMELKGSAAALLEQNVYYGKLSSMRSRSEHVARAFNYIAQQNSGITSMQHFTSISPYATMHVDVCSIAKDARANIVILPFHKAWEIDGAIGSNLPSIREVNQKVIQTAPCSVGILVDRGHIAGNRSILTGTSKFFISILFIGGPDDREALAYASRMMGHPQVNLTLVWLTLADDRSTCNENPTNSIESEIDFDLVNQFRTNTMGNERVFYKEEIAKDAVCTTRVLRSFEHGCDLCIVGREHDPESPLTRGLTDWSECPELGDVGDTLASTDFRFSVLVVQQLPPGAGYPNASPLEKVSSNRSFFSTN